MVQVNAMSGQAFFTYAAELMKVNPPHITDQPIVARMRRLGIEPGLSFHYEAADPTVRSALDRAVTDGQATIKAKIPTLAKVVNGWQIITDSMGVYGTFYLKRAVVSLVGLGVNLPEDAIYPINLGDADGKPLNGAHRYVLHFEPAAIPPAEAFWSLTLYDEHGFPTANALNRCAIGDRDPLSFNHDGSLDLLIQHESPGTDRESNWLPAPAGAFNVLLRLYAPKAPVVDGRWVPPPVRRVD